MTNLVPGVEIVDGAEGLISAKKQLGAFSLDLTVRTISCVESGGSLDFGGSEYQPATVKLLEPVKKGPDEPYGWWNLEDGSYLLSFNERIEPPTNSAIMLFPHERLLAAGSFAATAVVEILDHQVAVLLRVGPQGLAIKENARVCKAVVFA
jgi:hypothetical protein